MRTVVLLVIWGHICLAAGAAEPAAKTPPFSPLFDGKSFAGWEGNLQVFRIQDGAIVGGQMDKPVPRNEYLCTTKTYRDFELRLKFRLRGENVNAGVQFRSERIPGSNEMIGYQADMGQHYWGCLYDERRHKLLAGPTKEEQEKLIHRDDWNDYVIHAEGLHVQLWLNGHKTVDYTEPDTTIPQVGVFGLQIHQGAASEAWYKDLTIQVLPMLTQPGDRTALDRTVQSVIDDVDKTCRATTVYMIGPEKGRRLAELVRQKKPKLVVECGTAIGYSGLWIVRELKAAGHGKLITIEIDAARSKQARENFRRAGLDDVVDARVGDARKLVREIEEPVDFLFIDCDYSNYTPCLAGIEDRLADGAVVVADNVGIGAAGMKDYLDHVRSKYSSKTEWVDMDLPWGKRDAMEVTTVRKKGP